MIYASRERALEVAQMLNRRPGYPVSKPELTEHGWAVVCRATWGWTTGQACILGAA